MSTTVDDSNLSDDERRQKIIEEKLAQKAEEQRKEREEKNQLQPSSTSDSALKPTSILDETDKGIFFSKDKYPQYSNEEYTRYLSYQRGKRQKWIAEEWSRRDNWLIPLYQNNGGPDEDPFLDPDKPFTKEDAEHVKSLAVDQKKFDFHDASVKHFKVMQDIDNKYSEAIQNIQYSITSAPRGGIPGPEFLRLSENLRETENKRYRYGARLFLHMTDDEYDRAVNLQNVKDAVDAAIHRTANTIPNYTRTSSAGSSSIR